ncbi:MAG: acetylglutamate kinase [Bacteroidales bacterium]
MDKLTIVKVGGNLIDDDAALDRFLDSFANLKGKSLLVHGGGKLATDLATRLNIETKMVNGRRITDAENLKLVTMVYAGFVNKNIVARLSARGKNAVGICGCDMNLITSQKRNHPQIDFGFVGDITKVQADVLKGFIDKDLCFVVAPITHDGKGLLLNTNADSVTTDLAIALSEFYQVELIFSFEKAGVLKNPDNSADVIDILSEKEILNMQESGTIKAGMMPKTDNALKAARGGVQKVIIGNLELISSGISNGTIITI